jgi:hypothetical protein
LAGFIYKSYSFIDKDPIIDEVRSVIAQSGWTHKRVEDESGVTAKTLHAWFDGATRRPQAATINAVLRSLGYKLGVVPHTVVSNITSTAQPLESVRHVVQMAKFRRK